MGISDAGASASNLLGWGIEFRAVRLPCWGGENITVSADATYRRQLADSEEVAVEELNDQEVVLLSPEACRPQELVTLELAGHVRQRVNSRVAESRPA